MNGKSSNERNSFLVKNKEVDIMPTAIKLIDDERVFVKEMELYVQKLKKQSENSKKQAQLDAKIALKKTGVINRNGKVKKKIVSWE